MAKGRRATRKVSCEDCFFRKNLLCALPDDEPCATFRPAHPDGLRPPRQLRFQFRQERRTQSVWLPPHVPAARADGSRGAGRRRIITAVCGGGKATPTERAKARMHPIPHLVST